MSDRIIVAAIISVFLTLGSASAKTDSSGLFHIFSGEVKAVDLKARTITLKTHTRTFVFQITDETRISSFRGYVTWDKVRPGQGATVTMRLGEGNKGIAVKIRFDADAGQAKFLALFSARTTRGEMISGIAVSNFVVYEPPPMPINRGFDVGLNKLRMFRLSVRPDGTVASATPYVSFGNEDLDSRSIKWLMNWRFQPNSVTEVRMPVSWVYTYR